MNNTFKRHTFFNRHIFKFKNIHIKCNTFNNKTLTYINLRIHLNLDIHISLSVCLSLNEYFIFIRLYQ